MVLPERLYASRKVKTAIGKVPHQTAGKSGTGVSILFLFGFLNTFVVGVGICSHGLYLEQISAGFLRYLPGKGFGVSAP
jgi:hypothetical protein